MEHISCCLCGSEKYQLWMDLTDRFSGEAFQLVKCNQCGLIYSETRPSSAELPDHYPEDYEAYQRSTSEISAWQHWHADRMREMQVDYVEKFVSKPGKLLDIGCATGEFLSKARQRGWNVTGLELIERTASIARQRYGLDVVTGTLENLKIPDNSLDAITLWDVLEHLQDPIDALRRCHRMLKQGGMIYFSIPNLESFDRYLFGRSWIGWDAPRHFTLFNNHTLRQAFNKTGLLWIDHRCFLGGKGTFLLSLDIVLGSNRQMRLVKKSYPIISGVLWPYRQISYLLKRGPILAVAARRS